MILAMTLERFYATYFPFSYKNKFSPKVLTAIALACIVPALISCGLVTMVAGNENGFCFTTRSGFHQFVYYYIVLESAIIYNMIPASTVAVFNVLIACKIRGRQTAQRFVERQLSEFELFTTVHGNQFLEFLILSFEICTFTVSCSAQTRVAVLVLDRLRSLI